MRKKIAAHEIGLAPDAPGEKVVERARQETDTVFLAFSGGKDSIAAYLAIRGKFERIIPYHMYGVPDLDFVEANMRHYERTLFDGGHILRIPHPSLYRKLRNYVFQPPERVVEIEHARLQVFDYQDIYEALCCDFGLDPAVAMTASGVRACDSPQRRRHFTKRGAITWSRRTFYPVWDWNKDRLIREIREAGVKLGVDYLRFSRTFDGIDLRFLYQIREHFPRDYEKILEWFPLADVEIARYEFSKQKI